MFLTKSLSTSHIKSKTLLEITTEKIITLVYVALCCASIELQFVLALLKKNNLLGYTYQIYNSDYNNTEMSNTQCNAGDPLQILGFLFFEDHLC